MTKEEFLDEIKKELGFMPYEEVIKAEKYFESYFNGSEADEKVIERFGSPKYAAQNYYRTHVANSNANIKPPKKNRCRNMGVDNYSYIIVADTYTVGNSSRIFCGSDNIRYIVYFSVCIFQRCFNVARRCGNDT